MKALFSFILFLFLGSLNAQTITFFDIPFETNQKIIKAEALDELNRLLQSPDLSNLVVERFPKNNKSLFEQRLATIKDLVFENELRIDKIIHFTKVEHLYFDEKIVKDWDFIRLKYEYNNGQVYTENKDDEKTLPTLVGVQTHQIQSERTSRLELKGGCIIDVPAQAFCYRDGQAYDGAVRVEAVEILNKIAALENGISTNLEEGFLESRGMLVVQAYTEKGIPLELRANKAMSVQIPIDTLGDLTGFSVYEGTIEGNALSWDRTDTPIDTLKGFNHRYYGWAKIPAIKRYSLKNKRRTLIRDYKKKGWSFLKIQRRLWQMKRRYWKKNRRNKNRMIKSERDLERLTKSDILGSPKYKWTLSKLDIQAPFFRFRLRSLGTIINIDRQFNIINSRRDLMVEAAKDQDINLFFEDEFVVLKGRKVHNGVLFEDLPRRQKVIITSTKELEDGRVELGILKTRVKKTPCEIVDFAQYESSELKTKLEEVLSD